jgi:predicted neuraminidase
MFLSTCLFSLLFAPCQEANSLAIKKEFLYETAPFPECHASTLLEVKGGLIACWFGGTKEKDPDVGIWIARKSEKGWSTPVEIADGVQSNGKRHPCWNPVLCRVPGKIVLFYKVGPNPDMWWGVRKESTDEGQSWSKAILLPEGFLGPVKNKPVSLASGELLCPSSTETPEDPGQWRVHFEKVDSKLSTWVRIVPAAGNPPIEAIQPSILFLGGSKLLALGRSKQGKLFVTQSPDSGDTWSELSLLDVPNPNSGTDALTLKDGRHILVYNPVSKGRTPLSIAVSRDATTWKKFHDLETETGEYSYPAIIQTSDQKVHILYTWKRKKIAHLELDPSKIP